VLYSLLKALYVIDIDKQIAIEPIERRVHQVKLDKKAARAKRKALKA
jgi:hypothetical protein